MRDRWGGSFISAVRDQSSRLENVSVTPISTLVHRFMQSRPGMGPRRALRLVQRRLQIPLHYDQFDLQSDDSVFDGDRYLAAVRRAGGVSRLTRLLLADRTPRSFRELPTGRNARAAQDGGIAEWWKELDIASAVTSGLKDFGASFVWDNVIKAGGRWVLGRFLDAYGLSAVKDFLFPQSDTARLIEMVDRLNIRINALEEKSDRILKEIAELKAQVAATPAIRLLTHIDTNHNSLKNLAKLKPDEPGRAGATHALLRAIANDLDDRHLLNTVVAGKNGPGVLVLESRRAALAPFFTPKDSQEIHSVYDYYALYQLRLANLLTEYWTRSRARSLLAPPPTPRPTSRRRRSRTSSTPSRRTSRRRRGCSSPLCPRDASWTPERTSCGSVLHLG